MKYTVLTNGDVIKTKNELARTFLQEHAEHAVLVDKNTALELLAKAVGAGVITQEDVDKLSSRPVRPTVSVVK